MEIIFRGSAIVRTRVESIALLTARGALRPFVLEWNVACQLFLHGSTDVRASSLHRTFSDDTVIWRAALCCLVFVCSAYGVELAFLRRARRVGQAVAHIIDIALDERLLDESRDAYSVKSPDLLCDPGIAATTKITVRQLEPRLPRWITPVRTWVRTAMQERDDNQPVSKRMLKVVATVLLAWCLGGPLIELVDHWNNLRAEIADIA